MPGSRNCSIKGLKNPGTVLVNLYVRNRPRAQSLIRNFACTVLVAAPQQCADSKRTKVGEYRCKQIRPCARMRCALKLDDAAVVASTKLTAVHQIPNNLLYSYCTLDFFLNRHKLLKLWPIRSLYMMNLKHIKESGVGHFITTVSVQLAGLRSDTWADGTSRMRHGNDAVHRDVRCM
jgi:hypothetical protein